MTTTEKTLHTALQATLDKLIEVCPPILAGEKELVKVINDAVTALDLAK